MIAASPTPDVSTLAGPASNFLIFAMAVCIIVAVVFLVKR